MLILTRWIFQSANVSPQGQRSLILDRAVPARACVSEAKSYISRQGDDVWLTAVADPEVFLAADARLSALVTSEHQRRIQSNSDALLSVEAGEYRGRLHCVTDLAIELLDAHTYREHQQFLVRSMCAGMASVETLREYCEAHCASLADWSHHAQQEFWATFFKPGPRPELSCHGHWLWNIMVGPQPYPGDDPDKILAHIGAA